MPSQRAHLLGLVFASLVFGSCASRGAQLQPARTASPASDIEFSLYLIGDAGEPAPGGEPVLRALTATMVGSPGQAAVVFLGDNIYPKGLPSLGGPTRPEMERRLLDQIAAVRAPARGVFVPGNHDWEKSGPGGLASIQAQQAFISAHGDGDRITMSPSGGCPGPVTIDGLSPRLRVVALDTQWWLHAYDKGEAHCSAATEPQVLVALDAALASAGTRHVVLVAHHPLQSSGWHAGHFNWQDHFFPLTRVAKPLWIPLPGIGSLYPLFRITKPSPQDLGSREYSHLRAALGDVLRKHRPLLYAAGHEHELEVLKGDSARFFVVSGAGIYGHLTPTRRRAETLFRGTASGFMRIDLLQDGRPAPRVRCGWHRCRDAVVLDGPRLRAHIASAVTLPVGGGQLYDLTKNAIANIEHDEDDPRPAPRPSGPGAGFRYRDRRNPAGRTVESRLST